LALLRSKRLIAQSKLTSFRSATGISPYKNSLTDALISVSWYSSQAGLEKQGTIIF
jgi:hypothetical protein